MKLLKHTAGRKAPLLFVGLALATPLAAQTRSGMSEWLAGNKAFDDQDWKTAIAHYNHVIDSNPNFAGGYHNRALAKISLNQLDSSEPAGGNEDAAQKAFQDVITDLDKDIALNPKDDVAYYWRASCRKATGDWDGAIADADKSAALNPKNAGFAADMKGNQAFNWYVYGGGAIVTVILAVGGWSMVKELIAVSKAERAGK